MPEITIASIKIVHVVDTNSDTSYIGTYTDDLKPGVIVRAFNEFYERLPENTEIPKRGRKYRAFIPYAGGEKPGTSDYYKYGMQDYKRMEEYNNQEFCFIGIFAQAQVQYSEGNNSYRLETLSSSGLWGIESDATENIIETENDQLEDLKEHLQIFNVDCSNFDKLAALAKESPKEVVYA